MVEKARRALASHQSTFMEAVQTFHRMLRNHFSTPLPTYEVALTNNNDFTGPPTPTGFTDSGTTLVIPRMTWQGIEWRVILAFALSWELLYLFFKAYCASSRSRYADWPKVASLGGSYATAFLNALVCSVAGCWIVATELYDDDTHKAIMLPDRPAIAYVAAQSFLGWLLMDIIHLCTHYPTLGGFDMLCHHACFIILACLGSGFRYAPFVVGWLLMGEISSLFLNIRWLLINTGRGDTRALTTTNYLFALSFFVCRVLVFWAGLIHVLLSERPMLLSPPSLAPPWSVNLLCAFLLTGALLNAFWFVKIVKMAGGKKDHHNHGKKGVMEHNSLFPPPLKEPSALRQSGSSGQLSDVV